MTKNDLLVELKQFSETLLWDMLLPTAPLVGEEVAELRRPEVYRMRLPESASWKKKAPHVVHQIITSKDVQPQGERPTSVCSVRTLCTIYHEDAQEGGLALLELVERLRIGLLQKCVLGKRFVLDTEEGLETLIYPEDIAPFFVGEMATTWIMPRVEREVSVDGRKDWKDW